MISPYIKTIMQETGCDQSKITKVWDSAKNTVSTETNVTIEDFTSKEYAYTKDLVYKMLGVNEQYTISEFIKSDKSVDDFITEAIQSSDSFGITTSKTKKDSNTVVDTTGDKKNKKVAEKPLSAYDDEVFKGKIKPVSDENL